MSDDNPYQSPQFGGAAEDAAPVGGAGDGVWREGELLVIRKKAVLPDRCVMSNERANGTRVRRTYYWRLPPRNLATLLLWFLSLVPKYHQRNVVVEIPLSPRLFALRRSRIRLAWMIGLSGLGLSQLGAAAGEHGILRSGAATVVAMVGFAAAVVCGIVGLSEYRKLPTIGRIMEDYVWLKGVHPDYLAGLPEWPGTQAVDHICQNGLGSGRRPVE